MVFVNTPKDSTVTLPKGRIATKEDIEAGRLALRRELDERAQIRTTKDPKRIKAWLEKQVAEIEDKSETINHDL